MIMKHAMKHFLLLSLCAIGPGARAQFHTVGYAGRSADSLSVSSDPYAGGVRTVAKIGTNPDTRKFTQKKTTENVEKKFVVRKDADPKEPGFPFLSTSDSMLLELVKKRLTICMPLDFMHINSQYGYRKDPFTRCSKFHDGIDLRGGNELVFSMLPGKVTEVRHSNTGYGNYVILDHGSIRCLYGHLSEIYASKGSQIDAGTVVGRVGSSGRSTGTHLHIRLQRLNGKDVWQSVDPLPFIAQLNRMAEEYNRHIAELTKGEKETAPYYNRELNIKNLYEALVRHGVKYPRIVLAQALLETGNFTSRLCRDQNNLFGLRHSKGYYRFNHWEESVIAYRDKVQYKHRDGEGYYSFLRRINYASAKDYIYKVREIADGMTEIASLRM